MELIEQLLLAYAGFLFHLLKLWYAATNRKEGFINKQLGIWVAMNLLASSLLVYIGGSLPPDLIVMSPLTCIIIGFFGSSMLSGFIQVKRPKSTSNDSLQAYSEGDGGDGDDTGGTNPPPDKPKPPKPPGA